MRNKPTKYTQDALNGKSPVRQHGCKVPTTGKYGNHYAARKLFGFFNREHAKPHVVRRIKL